MLPTRWRFLIATAGAALSLAFAVVALPHSNSRSFEKTGAPITLVYVGAQDCAPCRIWQRGEGTAFHASAEFARLSYREIKPPTLMDVLKDDFWPEDLRIYRHAIGREAGVPLWLVMADDQVVLKGFGATQWVASILPKIKQLLR